MSTNWVKIKPSMREREGGEGANTRENRVRVNRTPVVHMPITQDTTNIKEVNFFRIKNTYSSTNNHDAREQPISGDIYSNTQKINIYEVMQPHHCRTHTCPVHLNTARVSNSKIRTKLYIVHLFTSIDFTKAKKKHVLKILMLNFIYNIAHWQLITDLQIIIFVFKVKNERMPSRCVCFLRMFRTCKWFDVNLREKKYTTTWPWVYSLLLFPERM